MRHFVIKLFKKENLKLNLPLSKDTLEEVYDKADALLKGSRKYDAWEIVVLSKYKPEER